MYVHVSHSYSFYEVYVQIIGIYLLNWLALLNCKFSLGILDKNLLSYSYVHYECFPSVSSFLFCFLKYQREDVFKFDEIQLSGVFFSYNSCFLCLTHLPNQISILFSSRSFIVLTFSFNSIFYFELNILYRVR